MSNKKLSRLLEPNLKFYFAVMLLFAVAAIPVNWQLALAEGTLTVLLYFYFRQSNQKRRQGVLQYIDSVTGSVDTASKSTLINSPLPTLVFRPDTGEIIWSNESFLQLAGVREHLFEMRLSEAVPDFQVQWLLSGKQESPERVELNNHRFRVYGSLVRSRNRTGVQSLVATTYWVDTTAADELRERYVSTRPVLAVLMVDFSCALKLAIPIAVLSAMRESSGYHISVKGGRFLEAVAKADTIVFDKTGTLTYATPTVAAVIPFGGHDEAEMLRLAACLEEHYPHSMANAVVEEAKRRGLTHEEYHSQVQYVVAHGISSMVEGKKVIIGSAHFVFEDEGCRIPAGEQPKFDALPAAYSHLYLCMDGELAAVICIHDPLRREARAAVRALHESGFTNVVMMTGDNRRTAESVAAEVGVDAVYAEVLPEDKAAFIRQEKEKGHTVIMVGDGVNDSPALSEADAGIAISTGAAIAREIADITVASEDLFALVTLRRLGEALMKRIHGSYRFIVGFNLTLIALGVAGVLPPTTSALLHNGSTLGISLRNMTDLLDEKENPRK